jgi:hypothetical protein
VIPVLCTSVAQATTVKVSSEAFYGALAIVIGTLWWKGAKRGTKPCGSPLSRIGAASSGI